jgi:hypothetical protein
MLQHLTSKKDQMIEMWNEMLAQQSSSVKKANEDLISESFVKISSSSLAHFQSSVHNRIEDPRFFERILLMAII